VLKTAVEEETQVVIRIIPAGESFAAVRVEAVDPFTQRRQVVLDGRPLTDGLDIRGLEQPSGLPATGDTALPDGAEWRAADRDRLNYLGVPDTTPEFTSEAALRLSLPGPGQGQGAGGGKTP
jgi:hypothetical protein